MSNHWKPSQPGLYKNGPISHACKLSLDQYILASFLLCPLTHRKRGLYIGLSCCDIRLIPFVWNHRHQICISTDQPRALRAPNEQSKKRGAEKEISWNVTQLNSKNEYYHLKRWRSMSQAWQAVSTIQCVIISHLAADELLLAHPRAPQAYAWNDI